MIRRQKQTVQGILKDVRVWLRPKRHKLLLALATFVMLLAQVIPFLQPQLEAQRYSLEQANGLLPKSSPLLAKDLTYDSKNLAYNFNTNYSPTNSGNLDNGGARSYGNAKIKAVANKDASKGVKVTDPLNQVDFTLSPLFDLRDAEQDGNRVYYPLKDNTGWLVYTMQAAQVSEDLVLTHAQSDKLQLKYNLGLGDSLAARMMSDGSVGIYGSELPINGNVSTSNAKDAALLAKLRQNAKKTKLLFTLPRPVIRQSGENTPDVQAKYILKGDVLTLDVHGLKKGKYPIDIDPSVYVQSAQGLMYGNNETNVNFDTTNNLFEKTPVSGGNIRDGVTQNSWQTTTSLPTGLWAASTVISGGYIYVIGGTTGTFTQVTKRIYWAQLNVSSSTPIGSWTTNTGYDLPVGLIAGSAVAYNDYLYMIGGYNGSGVVSTVYTLHLAASGEPTPSWVSLSTLPAGAGKQLTGAVAYQNQLYLMGGLTGTNISTTNTTAVYTASVKPDGTISSWTTTTSLPAAIWGFSTATYNGYVYAVGGAVGSTIQTAIYYAKITSAGTLGSWQTNSNALATARYSQSGNFMTIWAGYMYVSGGCSTLNASGFCTTISGDVQEAGINADGSITSWTTLKSYNTGSSSFVNISQARLGYGLVSFGTANDSSAANAGGTLYAVGGCGTTQNASTGACAAPVTTATYAAISSEGDIGPAQTTTSLPAAAGKFASAVVINNGYMYNVGGCTNNGCTTVTGAIYYAAVNSNGTIGSWTATTASLGTALAAVGATVLNNTLYTFGGSDGGNESANSYYGTMASTGNIATITANGNTKPTAALYRYVFSYVNPATPSQGYVYAMGGCQTSSGIGCTSGTYQATVYKCAVASVGATPGNCATTSQLQLPTGTGIAAGAQYGSYVYYASGANSGTSGTAGSWGGQTNLTYYAQIDDSGNIVLPPNKTGTTWPTATGKLADNGVTDASSDNAPGQRRRAAGFAVNGYLYILGGHDANANNGSGDTLQDMEIGKIDPTTGDIASFTDNYYQITPRWDFKGASANGYIYAVGGCSTGSPPASCTAEDLAVQYMQVYNNSSGSPASYTTASNAIGTPMIGASSAIYNGRMYVTGGSSTFGGAPTVTMQYSTIGADGSLGTWTTVTSGTGAMGTARMYHRLVANDGYLYAIGGQSGTANSTALTTTERSQLNASTGVPGAFSADSSLTTARSGGDVVAYNGYLYATGGMGTGGARLNTVEKSLINTSTGALGTWSTTGNGTFTSARMFHSAVAYNGTLYIIGGYDGTNYLPDVQYAQINTNGTIGSFSSTIQLPQAVSQGSAFAANGYLYVLGGRSAATTTGCTNNTYVASISANSTVAAGNVPNGLGNWSQTSVTFSGTRYGATASYYNGKAYLVGGSQCATNTVVAAGTTTYYSTLQSQPQVAQYSYAIDAINDVFPSKSLFNGIDNGIGASWQLDYKSSTNANATWGQNTSFGKTTLGTPQAYNPLDGSGTNTNYARWYWLLLSIDASQAFGYPEDVSRGPTIANLTIQFTANPSQRLRHGKTFINNVQQPLDAPF